jgi:hypothetical protein
MPTNTISLSNPACFGDEIVHEYFDILLHNGVLSEIFFKGDPLVIGVGDEATVIIGDDESIIIVGTQDVSVFCRETNSPFSINVVFKSTTKHFYSSSL